MKRQLVRVDKSNKSATFFLCFAQISIEVLPDLLTSSSPTLRIYGNLFLHHKTKIEVLINITIELMKRQLQILHFSCKRSTSCHYCSRFRVSTFQETSSQRGKSNRNKFCAEAANSKSQDLKKIYNTYKKSRFS